MVSVYFQLLKKIIICILQYQPTPNFIMNSILALLAIVGAASAGLIGAPVATYQTAAVAYAPAAQSHQFNNRAPAARLAVAAPVYAHAAPVYQAAPVAYAQPIVQKTLIPSAQSHQYNQRAPAARIAVAAPVYAHAAPVAVAHHAYAPAVHAVAAPVYGVAHAPIGHAAVVHQTFSTPFASYSW